MFSLEDTKESGGQTASLHILYSLLLAARASSLLTRVSVGYGEDGAGGGSHALFALLAAARDELDPAREESCVRMLLTRECLQ